MLYKFGSDEALALLGLTFTKIAILSPAQLMERVTARAATLTPRESARLLAKAQKALGQHAAEASQAAQTTATAAVDPSRLALLDRFRRTPIQRAVQPNTVTGRNVVVYTPAYTQRVAPPRQVVDLTKPTVSKPALEGTAPKIPSALRARQAMERADTALSKL